MYVRKVIINVKINACTNFARKITGIFTKQRDKLFFRTCHYQNGVLSAEQLKNLAECAEQYGNGTVTFTTRLTVEIPGIPFEHIDNVRNHVAKQNMTIGGTGAKIRAVTACKGTTCIYGNCDTQAIAEQLHHTFFEAWQTINLPHKFKIAVGGCPNSCMKPSLNDFGIQGHVLFQYKEEHCRSCHVCAVEKRCPVHAAVLENGKLKIDDTSCIHCGICSNACHFGAIEREAEPVFRIFVGGTWGKTTRMGTVLPQYYHLNEIEHLLEKTLLWYRSNGYQKERFGAVIDRVGFEVFLSDITDDNLIKHKEDILALDIPQKNNNR